MLSNTVEIAHVHSKSEAKLSSCITPTTIITLQTPSLHADISWLHIKETCVTIPSDQHCRGYDGRGHVICNVVAKHVVRRELSHGLGQKDVQRGRAVQGFAAQCGLSTAEQPRLVRKSYICVLDSSKLHSEGALAGVLEIHLLRKVRT